MFLPQMIYYFGQENLEAKYYIFGGYPSVLFTAPHKQFARCEILIRQDMKAILLRVSRIYGTKNNGCEVRRNITVYIEKKMRCLSLI